MVDRDPHSPTESSSDSRRVERALQAVEAACRDRGKQLTPIRRSVLEALLRQGQMVGAYELMNELQRVLGRSLSPPTVYRTLDFLLEQGFVTKIESKNAYVPCAHPEHPHACVFFICNQCGASEEIENTQLEQLFTRDAASLGFRLSRRIVELQGTCANCLDTPHAAQMPAM
ncbi:Fur family transcriptional regulator [Bradyrhizobium sp. WSM3983]|uniref:Fur family transcriptional regulator n=1 Tax=Bradyrhizobium sp. WSM3983 TaxID=1038867 RepID=UPI0007C457DC|nr:Fur family transcriptional regulator [Bradyrhizobium sp. WSM3983]